MNDMMIDMFDIVSAHTPLTDDKEMIRFTYDVLRRNDVWFVFLFKPNNRWYVAYKRGNSMMLKCVDSQEIVSRSLSNPVSKDGVKREWNEFMCAISLAYRHAYMTHLQLKAFEECSLSER